jgi:hemolysin activation/secretion protein
MAGLRLLTDELAAYYADRGYPFVRIYLPEQDLGLGILQLVVVEGRYGAIRIEPGQNLPAGLAFDRQVEPAIQSFLSRIQVGDFIRGPDLERSTLLLDDQPGVKVTPIIQPGEALGTGDLMIRYQRTAPMTAEVVLDSHGSRFTGARRAKVDLSWNSPFVFGDQLRLIGMLSEGGLHLGSVAYSRLVSGEGLRIRASYSYTDYQLGQDYASLKRSGVVQIPSIGLSYPIVRSQATNLTLSLNLQRKTFLDYDGLQLTRERKESQSAPITAQFDFRDQLLGGGINYGYLTLTPGQLKLEGTALATDQSTARTNGAFTKGELDFSRLQALPGALSLSLRWYQQLTLRKNLDASEGVSFGGPTGVRAYPVGEGSGDSGQLLQIELRHTLQGYIAYTFFDQARVKINARAYDSSVNYREFSGAGFGLRANRGLADGKAITGDAVLAWSTGGGASQSDSRVRSPRVWLSGGYRF